MSLIFRTLLALATFTFISSCSCERLQEAKQAVDNVKNLAEAAETMTEELQEAEERLEERKAKGDTMAIHYEELAKLLPESYKGYTKSGDLDGGTTKTPGMGSYSNVSQRYENGDGDQLRISITDYNAAYAMFTTVMGVYMAGFEIDNTREHVKGFEMGEDMRGWTEFQKKDGDAQINAGVGDRFHINVEADNQEDVDMVMDVATKAIDIDKLQSM